MIKDHTFVLSILTHIPDAKSLDGIAHRAHAYCRAIYQDLAGTNFALPEKSTGKFSPARSHQAVQAEDLPPVKGKVDSLMPIRSGERLSL